MQLSLIIGLGNPGKMYENTYHNVGFLFIDFLKNQLPLLRQGFGGQATTNLLKSDTFMNESGIFVRKAVSKRNIPIQKLLIVHDDSDILLGSFKYAYGRGAGGHKGVESIMTTLKTKNFWRLRIGIRPDADRKEAGLSAQNPSKLSKAGLQAVARRTKAGEFVLKKMTKTHQRILEQTFVLAEAKMTEVLA